MQIGTIKNALLWSLEKVMACSAMREAAVFAAAAAKGFEATVAAAAVAFTIAPHGRHRHPSPMLPTRAQNIEV